jgi:hypothetical protein
MTQFGYRCRNCGETWFLAPVSTSTCEWCEVRDPFGGDTHKTRPTFEELARRYAQPSCAMTGGSNG